MFNKGRSEIRETERGRRHSGHKMPNFSAQCVKGVQGIGYVCSFLLSLCICVPMSMHQDQFKGHCLLFSTGVWQEKDGQLLVSWANQAYCNFTIFVAVIQFVISLFQFVR